MKCPNCGAELADGHLYCDVCHEEICFVPNFDPELENSIVETLSNVAEEVMPTGQLDDQLDNMTEENISVKERNRYQIIMISGVCFIVFCVTLFFYTKSIAYQNGRAVSAFRNENYEKAAKYYESIIEADKDSLNTYLQLGRCYVALNERDKILEIYLHVLTLDASNEEAYDQIIDIYNKEEEFDKINALLLDCEDTKILEQYRQYLANVPDFSVIEGTYSAVVSLKLRSNTTGTIYYTLDGQIPDQYSDKYTVPIFLESGTHTVQALFINDYGMESAVKSATYTIEVQQPYAPEVNLYSGDYTENSYIIVEEEEGCMVYYTTDGTNPTRNSMVYTSPISMPIGKSEFRFMNYSEVGGSGKVTVRNYQLTLPTEGLE